MLPMKNIFIQKYLAEKISLQKAAGSLNRLSSVLAKSTIDLNPHQIYAALYAFNSPLSRGAILADEVGLGKTIEAGIVISQLWAEGKHRILIMCPASLRTQWQDELQTKFGLESEVWDGPSFSKRVSSGEKTPFTYDGIFITSYQFVYKNLGLIEKQDWDVVIIDEAHRFRRVYRGRDASKMAYEIREILKDKPKVLLTATPLQNGLEELYGIASFIDDKLLGSPYSFKYNYIDPVKSQASNAAQKLDELRKLIRGDSETNLDEVTGIVTRTLRKQVLEYVPFTDRTSLTFDFTPNDEEVALYEKVSEYLQRPEVAAIQSTQRNLMILVYRKLLASSSFAIAGTLEKLIANLKQELDLRQNDQKLEEVNPEEISDEGLEDELEELELESIESTKKEKQRIDSRHTDEVIKNEIIELESYLEIAKKIKENSKGVALVRALNSLFIEAKAKRFPDKAVVFTESTRTQEYLITLLRIAGISFTQFNGSNNSVEAREAFERWKKEFPEAASQGSGSANVRQALIYDFKTRSQVFLTTEAGSEGLNLQFSNIVINYDLPWNPQRVEQRIGRCHRYGQKHQVIVSNFLNTKNHADRRVLQLLQEKLNLFDGLFGSSDEVLGALESGVDFEKRILEIYQNCKTPDQYDKAFEELQESLKGTISDNILKYRKLLLEETDQSVAELFKKTMVEAENAISEFDKSLIRLCEESLDNKDFAEIGKGLYKIKGAEFPLAFRELKKEEIGKITRASKENLTIATLVSEALDLQTNPIPSIAFNLSKSENTISQLKDSIGCEGFVFLWKLKIIGVETEEMMAPLVFLKNADEYKMLDIAIATELLSIGSNATDNTYDKSPISQEELISKWNEWKKTVLDKYNKRNEKLFDRESSRLKKFYDDYTLKIDNQIEKLEDERKEIDRKRDNSSDYEERRKYLKRAGDIDVQLDRLKIQKLKLSEEAADLRKKELDNLWQKLEPKTNEELVAVTHFEIA
jgi:ERCC4-related helicase